MGDHMREAPKLFKDLGIRSTSSSKRHPDGMPMATCAGNVVERLIKQCGLGHVTLTLRTIVESAGNDRALIADVIEAVSDVIKAHPRWADLGMAWLGAFDQISLLDIRKKAKSANVRPLRTGIATLVCIELDKILGPSRPTKPARPSKAQVVSERLALGISLLRIKTEEPARFAAAAYELHKIDPKGDMVRRTMAAARLYGGRPEITGAVCWHTLIALSSPSLPADLRRKFEAAIIGGQTVRAQHIRNGRLAHAKRRAVDQPARMAA
jgi:hypothetical protein